MKTQAKIETTQATTAPALSIVETPETPQATIAIPSVSGKMRPLNVEALQKISLEAHAFLGRMRPTMDTSESGSAAGALIRLKYTKEQRDAWSVTEKHLAKIAGLLLTLGSLVK